ncbi:MAG: dTMP kinase [Myxococcota bacterium]|nr:dTMP kinase [Myxococcota bacterium]
MSQGLFIVIEGLDGAGTTTQARLLVDWLSQEFGHAIQTAQPSRGPIGVMIREVLQGRRSGSDGRPVHAGALAALFVADRIDHLASTVEPALLDGVHVVCDRYVHSSLAYQGLDNDVHWVAAMNGPMRVPDLTVLVHVTPDVAAERRGVRGDAAERFELDELQKRVYDGYLAAHQLRPDDPWVHVDGEQDIQAVHRAICEHVGTLLGQRESR